ncbi:hypothetical protein KIW84_050377 [Lathyrus oleraceus]|uniref:Arabidopsis retrotransposon Orf1 C-terminal domain-containing protein n=1 Tax=Pisum sativum TaxID=3888 RepID=A0A9D4WJ74_PEA|nr:hypothetical protein KIW84_050377 [Pisum sativum]
MHPNFYADDYAMTVLGLRDSVLYLLNQIGWETTPIRRQFVTYRRLTLEFLSSLIYLPNHGKGINRGFIQFRMFNMEYQYNIREFTSLLGFPTSFDTFTMNQEDLFEYRELEHFWGSLTGNDEPEEHEFLSGNIHNPAFRYLHKILAHTLFGKSSNITTVSHDRAPIQIGGLITMIANAIGLRQPMLDLNPFCGIQPMNINFLFNTLFIGNLGPEEFELLINNQDFYLFTMPSPMTSIHNRNNWLYNLDGMPSPVRSVETIQDYEILDNQIPNAESDPQTPTGYHDAASPPHPIPSVESAVPDFRHHMPETDYNTAIQALMSEQDTIREELTMMGNEFMEHMSRMTNQFHELLHRVNSFAPTTRDSTSG